MQSASIRTGCVILCAFMLGAPFLLLALTYPALPSRLVVLRGPLGVIMAEKSFFSAFRVPAMNLIAAMIGWLMLSRNQDFEEGERREAFVAAFTTLIFAVALKSDFEALEISAPAFAFGALSRARLTFGTGASIVGGVVVALFRGRKVRIPWTELRFPMRIKIALIILFCTYR